MTSALEARDDDGPFEDQFVALLVPEGNGPAAEFVVAFNRINQMAEERVAPQLTVAEHVESGIDLQGDRLVHRAVFNLFELGVAQLARLMALPRFFYVGRPKQTANDVATIGCHHRPISSRLWPPTTGVP